ncbi:YkgJ family cysteine cluster protein [Lysobacter enzymogenes]|uniref:YkgJ family cysteine cluster protein n=1 Tax=Lysobacter enzymogenes TaxID=69 RepID=UPI0037493C14
MDTPTPIHKPLCASCDAVCCRLTVVVQPEDRVPDYLTARTLGGLTVMARDEEGWCVAIDPARMCCAIYDARPDVCRRFVMSGPYCQEVREDYRDRTVRGIPLRLY